MYLKSSGQKPGQIIHTNHQSRGSRSWKLKRIGIQGNRVRLKSEMFAVKKDKVNLPPSQSLILDGSSCYHRIQNCSKKAEKMDIYKSA
jgi:hypothetical protein